ncbi:hypothetical protein [Actinocrinis sp.]|uniref:hypothetical protein n=1 Tax=Actinocrinis sp. TaxID=1920516 RepID=UPI002D30C7DA|nr:hypothetical protein [Actinocrinis sp.]HZP49659.1 hypothetical protein [Actinocrinis sp.]
MSAGVGVPGRDPAVETWREVCTAANPAVLAVAADARCLLLALPGMPRSEQAAMAEEFRAAESWQAIAELLRSWRITAGLHAAAATNGTQQDRNYETKDGS